MKTHLPSRNVWLSERDTLRMLAKWPGSAVCGHRVRFQFGSNGDLIDVEVDGKSSEEFDGPDLLALSRDAHALLLKRMYEHRPKS